MASAAQLELPPVPQLQTTEQIELLDVIDSLRAEGLSEITSLPQLIVCGDQSTGKSSVLEAISGIPFPKQENLCTRFATEVVLRRAPSTRISVSILPSQKRSSEERKDLSKFGRRISHPENFAKVFEAAATSMLGTNKDSFCEDILRIEVYGKNQPQLTLVDLPGLIHSRTATQTVADIQLVSSLVTRYLQSSRSIILAVVSAKYDIGIQSVLDRARGVDPKGVRTLGIITKPDTLEPGSESERSYLRLAKNESVKFKRGWHILRNIDSSKQGERKETLDQRAQLEESFFKQGNFSTLPSHTVGITTLKTRLSKILFEQIQLELPNLLDELDQRITATSISLKKLGEPRSSLKDQERFLIDLSEDFRRLCQAGTRGDYLDPFFHQNRSEQRICATIMEAHQEFAKSLKKVESLGTTGLFSRPLTREEAVVRACEELKRNRGRELPGLSNPFLVGVLFKKACEPWEAIAKEHINNVWEMTKRFVDLILRHLTDEDSCEKILIHWIDKTLQSRRDAAFEKLQDLLELHQEEPFTNNPNFTLTRKQLEDARAEQRATAKKEGTRSSTSIHTDSDMQAAEEALDIMNAYYEIAMLRFQDNVPTLSIQAAILRKLDEILCPRVVMSMDPELIKRMAAESEDKMFEREGLTTRLTVLENGARLCREYAIGRRPSSKPRDSASSAAPTLSLFGTGQQSNTGLFAGLTTSQTTGLQGGWTGTSGSSSTTAQTEQRSSTSLFGPSPTTGSSTAQTEQRSSTSLFGPSPTTGSRNQERSTVNPIAETSFGWISNTQR